jgi:hypothetical protein
VRFGNLEHWVGMTRFANPTAEVTAGNQIGYRSAMREIAT